MCSSLQLWSRTEARLSIVVNQDQLVVITIGRGKSVMHPGGGTGTARREHDVHRVLYNLSSDAVIFPTRARAGEGQGGRGLWGPLVENRPLILGQNGL